MKKWTMQQYQSGSTLVTNGEVILYLHSFDSVASKLSDSDTDAMRFNYARWLVEVLNKQPEPKFEDKNVGITE